jgi:hypothetical protein
MPAQASHSRRIKMPTKNTKATEANIHPVRVLLGFFGAVISSIGSAIASFIGFIGKYSRLT